MNRFTVIQRNDTEDARGQFSMTDDLAPEPDASVRLFLAMERRGDYLAALSRVNTRPLASHLLVEIPRRFHAPVFRQSDLNQRR